MRYVTGPQGLIDTTSWEVGDHLRGLINTHEREMGYSPGGFLCRYYANSLGNKLVFKLGPYPPCPHSISFGFFIFMGIVVVIEGRRVPILSPGTGS